MIGYVFERRLSPTFFRCMIFSPWFEVPYTEDYATVSITLDANGTFVHEAGHCLGAFHDRYTSMGQGVISSLDDDKYYNYGYCLPGNKYATVMSYEYNCPKNAAGDDVEEILYFSNPDVSFEGVPTGDSLNNNAKTIRETRDETSQYGTNCYDGFPESGSAMGEKVCDWTPWTGFGDWGECCCAENFRDCPLVPYKQWWRYTPEEKIRKNIRTCSNSLHESVHKSGCSTEGDDEDTIWETEDCDCSAEELTTTTTEEPTTTTTTSTTEEPTTTGKTCISQSGVGDADARFKLTGLKPGDKVYFTYPCRVLHTLSLITNMINMITSR